MDPFAGIEAFAKVVECGSFTAAAVQLQTAKSSVSEAVRGLEERLGVRLLDRTTRKVRTTEAGLAFYARCRRLLDDAEAARAAAQADHGTVRGRLRIALPEAFASRIVVPGLYGFLNAHPGLEIDLVESQAISRLVEEGIDLAIRIVAVPEESLVVRRIGASQIIIVAASGYLAAAGAPATPAELAQHACVGFTPLDWRDTWRVGGQAVRVAPRLLTNASETLRAAALAGHGLVALPRWMVDDALAGGALAQVLPHCETPVSGIYAVYPTNRLLTPKVRAFVDHLAGELARRGFADPPAPAAMPA